jgi:hypothetical protein
VSHHLNKVYTLRNSAVKTSVYPQQISTYNRYLCWNWFEQRREIQEESQNVSLWENLRRVLTDIFFKGKEE